MKTASGEEVQTHLEFLADLGREIATQDRDPETGYTTHATAHPIYMVQQRVKDYGIDPAFRDPDGYEVDDAGHLVPYVYRWELVQGAVSLTRRGIEEYLALNRHNLSEPRIYVASMQRVPEMQRLRDVLMIAGGQE